MFTILGSHGQVYFTIAYLSFQPGSGGTESRVVLTEILKFKETDHADETEDQETMDCFACYNPFCVLRPFDSGTKCGKMDPGFQGKRNEILAGEWEVCIGRKMPSLSNVDEDFDVVPGIALVLDVEGNYTLTMSEEARSRFRRGGSRQFLEKHGERDSYSQFDPRPFTTNVIMGKYEVRISEKEGWIPIY